MCPFFFLPVGIRILWPTPYEVEFQKFHFPKKFQSIWWSHFSLLYHKEISRDSRVFFFFSFFSVVSIEGFLLYLFFFHSRRKWCMNTSPSKDGNMLLWHENTRKKKCKFHTTVHFKVDPLFNDGNMVFFYLNRR